MTDIAAKKPLGVYVHIPFCIRKCNYCDFVSFAIDEHTQQKVKADYMEKLQAEIENHRLLAGDQYFVDSIYYGGGTPTTVDAEKYVQSNRQIRDAFPGAAEVEITIEANPGTLNPHQLQCIEKAGFNRASLGVQSLDDEILLRMGRIHTAGEAKESYHNLRQIIKNINVDLMFGVPGQTMSVWRETLLRVLDWSPEHLSFYSLQLEEGTPFFTDYRNGAMDIPTWEANREMYHFAVETIKSCGYRHYEISNAAKPGYECRHNLKYWTMQDYLGLGVSAHSYMNGVRRANTSGLTDYNEGRFGGVGETGSRADQIGDYLFTELRLIRGFDLQDYRNRFGSDFWVDHQSAAESLLQGGFLREEGGCVRLTDKGLDHTNPVMERLLNA